MDNWLSFNFIIVAIATCVLVSSSTHKTVCMNILRYLPSLSQMSAEVAQPEYESIVEVQRDYKRDNTLVRISKSQNLQHDPLTLQM
jgi:hypothetical protein